MATSTSPGACSPANAKGGGVGLPQTGLSYRLSIAPCQGGAGLQQPGGGVQALGWWGVRRGGWALGF